MKKENSDWIADNRETLVNELVMSYSPYQLTELILSNSRFDDSMVEGIRKKIEKREGLLQVEQQVRAKAVAKKPKKVKETDEEAESRLMKEKTKEMEEKQANKKADMDSIILPDDNYVIHQPSEDMESIPF